MANPVLLVIGAGPGVGGSVARRFGREGYDVALVGKDLTVVGQVGERLQADGITAGWTDADVTDPEALRAAVDRLAGYSGRVDVLHVNPSAYRAADPLSLTVPQLLEDVALGVGALLTAAQAARPYLSAGARITATGSAAADRPSAAAASLGVQKAGLRNLVLSLDQVLAPDGIRAVSVTVDGVLSQEAGSPFHPDAVAEAIWSASQQPAGAWQPHLRHPAA